MNYGFSTYFYADERLSSHGLDQVLAAGFTHIEIFAARQHFDYRDPNHVRDIAQWFADHEVALGGIHAPLFDDLDWGRSGGLPISIAYRERRRRIDSMEEIKRALAVAEHLPYAYLVLHMGLPDEDYHPAKFDSALTSLEHLNIFAKERGVEILLENIPNDLSSPERLLQFVQYSRMDLKLCFDTGHAHLTGSVQTAFQSLKDHLAAAHLHDNHQEQDEHLFPFEGGIDWEQTVRDFRVADTQFPPVLEVRHQGPAKQALARLREVMQRLAAIP